MRRGCTAATSPRRLRVDLADGRRVFAKTHPGRAAGLLHDRSRGAALAARGRARLPVPEVLAVSDEVPPLLVLEWIDEAPPAVPPSRPRLGDSPPCTEPARRASAERTAARPGAGRCRTSRAATWAEFYAHAAACCRSPDSRATRGALPAPATIDRLERSPAGSADVGGPDEPPARLHGDLWAGNRLVDADGRSWLIDPAAHGGHREFDLAMMRLFGGFGDRLLRRVRRRSPRSPTGGQDRVAAPPDRAARGARDQVRRRLRAGGRRRDRPLRLIRDGGPYDRSMTAWRVGRATITPVVEVGVDDLAAASSFKGLDKPGVLDLAHRAPVARRDRSSTTPATCCSGSNAS